MADPVRGGYTNNRRRSSSESGTQRLSSTLDDNGTPLDTLMESNIRMENRFPSVPNVSSRGAYDETPLGQGQGTSLLGRTARMDGIHAQILEDFRAIKTRTAIWENQVEMNEISKSESDLIYDRLRREIATLSSDALCNLVNKSTYGEIRSLKDRIDRTKRATDRSLRRQPAIPQPGGAGCSANLDEVFQDLETTIQLGQQREEECPAEQHLMDLLGSSQVEEVEPEEEQLENFTQCEDQIVTNILNLQREAVHGFAPVSSNDGLQDMQSRLNDHSEANNKRFEKLEFTVLANTVRISRMETTVTKAQQDIVKLGETVQINSRRIKAAELSARTLEETFKKFNECVGKRLVDLESAAGEQRSTIDDEAVSKISENVKTMIIKNGDYQEVREIKRSIKELKRDVSLDQSVTEGLRELVSILNEKVQSINHTNSNINQQNLTRGGISAEIQDVVKSARECDIIKNSIERSAGLIRQLITIDVSNECVDISLIKKCKLEDAPVVQKSVMATEAALVKYVRFPGMNIEFYNEISSLLQNAGDWCLRVEARYAKMEVHAINNTKGDISTVQVFKDNFEQIVYEFLDELETAFLGWGTNQQRGRKVYGKLSTNLQSKWVSKSDDYVKLKEALIADYGRADRIVNDVLAGLLRKRRPTSGNAKDRLSYFSDILSALQRVEKLRNGNQIDHKRLDESLYSRGTLSTLMSLLPDGDSEDFTRIMTKENMDWNNPYGKETFTLFKKFCEIERNAMESTRPETTSSSSGTRNKQRSVHSVQRKERSAVDSGTEEEQETRIHAANTNKSWFQQGLKYPCPLGTHKHELSKCNEFLEMSPEDRWNNIERRRICFTCIQPKAVCIGKRCSSQDKVPEILLCKGCESDAVARGWAPLNILLCRKKEHSQLRAPWNEIKKKMESYFGKISTSTDEAAIQVSVSFSVSAATRTRQGIECLPETAAELSKMGSTPTIDSSTGHRVKTDQQMIVQECKEHSFFMMQKILIGDAECLVFFDSGSNAHLLDGSIAIEQGLQIMSRKPTNIAVVGGSQIRTEYGSFRFNLGPNEHGEFIEMTCIGMDNVSGEFELYDLTDICREYKEEISDDEILPAEIGGSKVHLLVGVKNTKLSPVLIKTLKSGVGVYKSPFKDVYGSRIIFAGPHSSFSKGERKLDSELSQVVYHIREQGRIKDEEIEDDIRYFSYSVQENQRLNLTLTPYAINPQDVLDAGYEVPPQFEDSMEYENLIYDVHGNEAHFCEVFKAVIPISRMRELVDQDDLIDWVTFRCSDCSKCIKCKMSRRRTAVSLQEAAEQEIIEKSVTLDLEKKKVIVKLPMLRDPTELLTKKHGGNSNKNQALKVYKSQCKKQPIVKEGVRKVQQELLDRGFMQLMSEFPQDVQKKILEAPFLHYYPWRCVFKEDSLSTPVRLVVDPTMSGLNSVLAKGENKIGSISDILFRTMAEPYSWSSDISKLYNQLHLEDSALPYSLFLYHPSLDENISPLVYVMRVAWYGVTSTGAQAGEALDRLATIKAEKYPLGANCVINNRYVDDLSPGAQTREIVDKQIQQTSQLLSEAGFEPKYVVVSGEKPCAKASSDGISVKLLGYKWNSEEDTIQLGFGELNMNKKVRGSKKPNLDPVFTRKDAEKLLNSFSITRRVAVSKVAEIYDPLGWCEIVKLQLKLELTKLNDFGWDEELPAITQEMWKNRIAGFVDLDEIKFKRCRIPADIECTSGVRLICLSDAAQHAGGAVVYAGRKLIDGTWSCSVFTAKSKLMKSTIPRNELSAIMLMTEIAFLVKRSLSERVTEMIFVTDSTIAMSWCHNVNIKLRLFVRNRVETIRRMIEWATDSEKIPLYHVDGELNVADYLTKPHQIEVGDVSLGSVWQDGLPWMKLDTEAMPLRKYSDLAVSKTQELEVQAECFEEPFLLDQGMDAINSLHARENLPSPPRPTAARGAATLLVDPVLHGWFKTIRIMNIVLGFIEKMKHGKHKLIPDEKCQVCKHENKMWDVRYMEKKSEDALCKYETKVLKYALKSVQLRTYEEREGILYYSGRLTKEAPLRTEDLDEVPFLDIHEFVGDIPVLMIDSPILYSYLMAVHLKIKPHAGVETHVKEIYKKFLVRGPLRALISKIISRCVKCRLREKKRVELKLSNHPGARTVLAPPFYTVMMDIAYGFEGRAFKRARTKIKIYALIIVCLVTGATSILALEGIETQDIVQAIERHAARYGIPADLYVDQGTQLIAMNHAQVNFRDVNARLYDSVGLRVHVSNAKAHNERGRVERRIGLLRETMEKMGEKTSTPRTAIQWETVFARIASTLDDLPLAKGNTSNVSCVGFEIITPNRLKLGRNNNRSLEGSGINVDMNPNFTRILEANRSVFQHWYQLFIDNIHFLTLKPDIWRGSSRLPIMNDIVLFLYNDSGQGKDPDTWRLGRVVGVSDRKVTILFSGKEGKSTVASTRTLVRSMRDVSILFSADEFMINTADHFQELNKSN